MKSIDHILEKIGDEAGETLGKIDKNILNEATEIKYIVNNPLEICKKNISSYFTKNGKKAPYEVCEKLDIPYIEAVFYSICDYSVHTYIRSICEGFVTIEGGSRAGFCGTAVYDENKIINLKNISSINIRIAKEMKGISEKIFSEIGTDRKSVLLVGPPCSGKTTMLRDMARVLGENGNHVSVVDERNEIAGTYNGTPAFNLGKGTSVLNMYSKCDGIISAVRSLDPDFIVCDEFGSEQDLEASLYALKSGADIIASIHAFDRDELIKKPFFKSVIEHSIFDYFVFLNKDYRVTEIVKQGDLI